MNTKQFISKLFAVIAMVAVFQACVKDDDFDTPVIDPAVVNPCFEDFESYTDGATTVAGYQLISTAGTNTWNIGEFRGNKHIQMSGFRGSSTETDWFIMGVDFDNVTAFSFDSKDGFNKGDVLTVLYSTNYDATAGTPDTATWKDITSDLTIATGTDSGYAANYTYSGEYDLSALSGNGYIAFKYDGGSSKSTTYQIDNITFKNSSDASCRVDLTQPGGSTGSSYKSNGDSATATPLTCKTENFEAETVNNDNLAAYENIAYSGERFWQVKKFDNNKYIQLTAHNAPGEIVSYFAVPVNFTDADSFSFKTKDGFNNGNVLNVYYTTNHTIGADIATATLTDITSEFTIASGASSGYATDYTASGEYSLSSLTGNGFIVFKYTGDGTGTKTTMQIDDITIVDKEDTSCSSSTGGGGTPTGNECASQDFESFTKDVLEIEGYQLISTDGKNAWQIKEHSGNKYIQARGYQGDAKETDWFIIGLNFNVATSFSFDSKDGFNNGNGLKVLYSTDYDANAGKPNTATWTDITSNFTIASGTSSGYASDFTASGNYDLSSLTGNGYIAFKFEGGTDSVTTTYQIDNIVVNSATSGTTCSVDLTQPTSGGGGTPPAGGKISEDVYFSEYAEGSGSNKYIEIYNPSGEEIDLTRYEVRLNSNEDTEWKNNFTFDAGTTLASKEVFVISNSGADADAIKNNSDATGTVTYFNGNDALGLFLDKDGDGTFETMLDIIGVIAQKENFSAGGVDAAAKNHTLIRKTSVTKGSTDWNATSATEWDVKDQDDFSSAGVR